MRVLSFLWCDDVRREVDGKSTLVGVYDGLSIPRAAFEQGVPVGVRVAAHMRVAFDESDTHPDRVRIRLLAGTEEVARIESGIVISTPQLPVTVALPMVIVPMKSPGTIAFEFEFIAAGETTGEMHRFACNVIAVDGVSLSPTPPTAH